MTTPSIAILGGGPSGLALARLLQVHNITYTVYERDSSASWAEGRHGTGTLDLHPHTGQMALKAAGLFEQFEKLARSDGKNVMADSSGKVVLDMGRIADAGRPEIDRRDLRRLLLDAVPEHKIRWGWKVEGVERGEDGGIEIRFVGGEVVKGFKLVVGADGAWSKTRKLLTDARPRYSGFHFFCSNLKPGAENYGKVEELAGTGNYMAVGGKRMLGAQRLGDKSYYTFVGLNLPESWSQDEREGLLKDAEGMRRWLVDDVLAGWPKEHTDVVEHSTGGFFDWNLYEMPPESLCWESVPGVTVIGDAAHVTTPFLGEGVNCAMHDSYELAMAIVKHGLDNIDQAVKEYEQGMFPRAKQLITGSARNGELLLKSTDAPYNWVKLMAGQMEQAGAPEMQSMFIEAANGGAPTNA